MFNRWSNALIEDANLFLAVPLILDLRNKHLKTINHFRMNIFTPFAFWVWIIFQCTSSYLCFGDLHSWSPLSTEAPDIPHSTNQQLRIGTKKYPIQCYQQNHNDHPVQITMNLHRLNYRWSLLWGWDIHFNPHYHSYMLYNLQAFGSNVI